MGEVWTWLISFLTLIALVGIVVYQLVVIRRKLQITSSAFSSNREPKLKMKRLFLFVRSTGKRFVIGNLLEKGKLGTASPSFSHCCFSCYWVRASSSVSYDYREILRNGLRDIKLDDAVGLFGEMVKSRPFPSIIEFNKLLSAIAKMKKYDAVISLGNRCKSLGILHDLYTYSIFINCFCRSSQIALALAILGKMTKLGYEPKFGHA